MKKVYAKLFNATMKIKSAHNTAIMALGFTKEFARETPVSKLLASIAFNLCKAMH